MTDLVAIARSLFVPGKGILAADESVPTATKRLAEYGIAASEEMRREFRDLFLGAPGVEEYLSGVILFPDSLREKGNDKRTFPESLGLRGIVPGVKVDLGTEPMPNSPSERITQGLLDLAKRLEAYKQEGAVFTKWRAVITIAGDDLPSAEALHENAKRLALYAKEVQTAGMVPIIEPEVLYEGSHSRTRAAQVVRQTLGTVFSVLEENAVDPSSVVLKCSMVLSGAENASNDTAEDVAADTLTVLTETVPRHVPGIAFLSGGQTPEQATENFTAIVRRAKDVQAPWPLTFSFARALQTEALALWKGKEENVFAAREAFLHRLALVSAAMR